jgi:type IV secretory pathway VirJ component
MMRLLLLFFLVVQTSIALASPQPVDISHFGRSRLYLPAASVSEGFIVLLSSSAGWDEEAERQAAHLQQRGYSVLGLDVRAYEENRKRSDDQCLNPSRSIEEAAQDLQKKPGAMIFHRPIVVGLGDSGMLAAAVMLQNMPGTYRAAIAPQFCPEAKHSKPLCLGSRLRLDGLAYHVAGQEALKEDEGLFLGSQATCSQAYRSWPVLLPLETQNFIDTSLEKDRNKRQSAAVAELSDLPLTYLPASGNDWLVILLSGDGGWRDIDRQIGEKLQAAGYAVVGLDSLRYFWHEQSPEMTAATLDRLVERLSAAWHKERVALVGYSFGADVLPFSLVKMHMNDRIKFMALLGFGRYALFEITVGGFWGEGDKRYDNAQILSNIPLSVAMLCIYGQEDRENSDDEGLEPFCASLHGSNVTSVGVAGGHHFNGDYQNLTTTIIDNLRKIKKVP